MEMPALGMAHMYEWFLMGSESLIPSIIAECEFLWTTFEFHSKPEDFVQNIAFAKHEMQLQCFETSMH